MHELAQQYPGYSLEKHKGYGTAAHLRALTALGVTPIHRRSFAPVAALVSA
jgi:ribonuclease HII